MGTATPVQIVSRVRIEDGFGVRVALFGFRMGGR